MGSHKSPCTPGKRATILTTHPVSRQGGWAASDTRMGMARTAPCCPHPALPRPVTARDRDWGFAHAKHHSPQDKHSAAWTGQCKRGNAHQRVNLHKCSAIYHQSLSCSGMPSPSPTSTWKRATTILNVAQCFRGSTEHRPQVHISAAASSIPCQLGPAGLHTSPQSPGLHLSARSASQHQQRTRGPLHTEKRDSMT